MSTTCDATNHGTWRAYKHYGCTCPSENRERYVAHKQRVRRDDAARAVQKRADAPVASQARFPSVRPAVDLEKELWARDDLACVTVDPRVFNVIGAGTAARKDAREAAAICATCPALQLCLEVGLNVDRPDTVMGGLTYSDRCDMRRRERVAA